MALGPLLLWAFGGGGSEASEPSCVVAVPCHCTGEIPRGFHTSAPEEGAASAGGGTDSTGDSLFLYGTQGSKGKKGKKGKGKKLLLGTGFGGGGVGSGVGGGAGGGSSAPLQLPWMGALGDKYVALLHVPLSSIAWLGEDAVASSIEQVLQDGPSGGYQALLPVREGLLRWGPPEATYQALAWTKVKVGWAANADSNATA